MRWLPAQAALLACHWLRRLPCWQACLRWPGPAQRRRSAQQPPLQQLQAIPSVSWLAAHAQGSQTPLCSLPPGLWETGEPSDHSHIPNTSTWVLISRKANQTSLLVVVSQVDTRIHHCRSAMLMPALPGGEALADPCHPWPGMDRRCLVSRLEPQYVPSPWVQSCPMTSVHEKQLLPSLWRLPTSPVQVAGCVSGTAMHGNHGPDHLSTMPMHAYVTWAAGLTSKSLSISGEKSVSRSQVRSTFSAWTCIVCMPDQPVRD